MTEDKAGFVPDSGTEGLNTRWPVSRIERPEVLYDVDSAFHDLYDEARAATQMNDRAMRRQRHSIIPQILRRVKNVPGVAAEVGCFRGLSAYLACAVLSQLGRTMPFHVFDSFEGLSVPVEADFSSHLKPAAAGAPNPFTCSEEQVRSNLARFSFVDYHAGWVPDRFNDVAAERFCFVHIDVDLYEPTRDSIRFFWDRLSVGGAIVLDDHGTLFFPGARRAVDEYFAERNDFFLFEMPAGSAVVVKLGSAA